MNWLAAIPLVTKLIDAGKDRAKETTTKIGVAAGGGFGLVEVFQEFGMSADLANASQAAIVGVASLALVLIRENKDKGEK